MILKHQKEKHRKIWKIKLKNTVKKYIQKHTFLLLNFVKTQFVWDRILSMLILFEPLEIEDINTKI
jgi:hypothetical protein